MNRQIEQLKKGPQIVWPPRPLAGPHEAPYRGLVPCGDHCAGRGRRNAEYGLLQDVRHILDTIKSRKRLAMFSATISREVMDIGWLYQRDAEEITVQPWRSPCPKSTST